MTNKKNKKNMNHPSGSFYERNHEVRNDNITEKADAYADKYFDDEYESLDALKADMRKNGESDEVVKEVLLIVS